MVANEMKSIGAIEVPETLMESLGEFIQKEGIALSLVAVGGADDEAKIRVVQAEAREQGDAATLPSGGWITCADALEMARQLNIKPNEMGRIIDFLDIKIRQCSLGCF